MCTSSFGIEFSSCPSSAVPEQILTDEDHCRLDCSFAADILFTAAFVCDPPCLALAAEPLSAIESNECRELVVLLWDLLSSVCLCLEPKSPHFVLDLLGLRYFASHVRTHMHTRAHTRTDERPTCMSLECGRTPDDMK